MLCTLILWCGLIVLHLWLQVQAVGIDVALPWEASQLLAVLEQLAQIGRVPESVLDAHLPIFLRHTRLFTSAAA